MGLGMQLGHEATLLALLVDTGIFLLSFLLALRSEIAAISGHLRDSLALDTSRPQIFHTLAVCRIYHLAAGYLTVVAVTAFFILFPAYARSMSAEPLIFSIGVEIFIVDLALTAGAVGMIVHVEWRIRRSRAPDTVR